MKSIRKKNKLVHGHGVNDYGDNVYELIGSNYKPKSFYLAWKAMMARCYSEKQLQVRPTYIGCTVCDEWLSLTNFKAWYNDNYVKGFHLDKDIIKIGNKVYSPELCRYVSPQLNALLNIHHSNCGKLPVGIYLKKSRIENHFIAEVNYKGKRPLIGSFKTAKEAFTAYANAKHKIIIEAVKEQTDVALREGLVNHAKALLNEAAAYESRI